MLLIIIIIHSSFIGCFYISHLLERCNRDTLYFLVYVCVCARTLSSLFVFHLLLHLKARVHEEGEGRERRGEMRRQPVRADSDFLTGGEVLMPVLHTWRTHAQEKTHDAVEPNSSTPRIM